MERKSYYVMRHNELEHVWELRIVTHGFNHYLYVRGTDSEVREYIASEFPEAHEHGYRHALSESEVEMLGRLHITVYIAPEI